MKFKKLYDDNRDSVVEALTALWCGELATPSQEAQGAKLEQTIKKHLFAPTDTWPIIQCMNSWVSAADPERAKSFVEGLWTASYAPYQHQTECWEALKSFTSDGRPKSICVTTGTGSGKTECFMLPLVDDLRGDEAGNNQIKAIFLYPLNALMEDQKSRLQELIKGTGLKFAVYNGELPEKWPEPADPNYRDVMDTINHLRGGNSPDNCKYPDLIVTREDLRNNPPDILLTNPTMLEYILLRRADDRLIDPTLKSLRWVVLDETHTYTGAGATEMAMLLRRVMMAFGVDPRKDVRFATSSATFGNGTEAKELLRKFISDITGAATEQIEIVEGKRVGNDVIPAGQDEGILRAIFQRDFVSLKELYPDANTIDEALGRLDELCDRCEKRAAERQELPKLRVKVHYFYRVPNNGVYVRLTEHRDGAFRVYPEIPRSEVDQRPDNPLLEMGRCKNCGEYVAVALYNETDETYTPVEYEEEDMFDLDRPTNDNHKKYAAISLSNSSSRPMEGNIDMRIDGNKLVPYPQVPNGQWHLLVNTARRCPCCGKLLTRTRGEDSNENFDPDSFEETGLKKLRAGAEFISRIIAPSILDNVQPTEVVVKDGGLFPLHHGQQFLSFADSRQMAAKSTLNQNVEQERMWVYSTIYHELNRRAGESVTTKADYQTMIQQAAAMGDFAEVGRLSQLAASAPDRPDALPRMTWIEVAELLKADPYFDTFCTQFLRRGANSDEMNHGEISNEMREKYVHSIMAQYLAPHPKSAQSPENLGLFHTCYPQLESVHLPQAVTVFNERISLPENRIDQSDWRNLLNVFMDYRVRVNQSFSFKLPGRSPLPIDIFDLERFASQKPHRRPVVKPSVPRSLPQTMILRYLAALLAGSTEPGAMKDAYRNHRQEIQGVVDALWRDLTETPGLVEWGEVYNHTGNRFERERGRENEPDPWRLNLVNLSFTLFDDVNLVDTNTNSQPNANHISRWRPTWVNFKGFSPYMINNIPQRISQEMTEAWSNYRHDDSATRESIKEWAKTSRKLLWDNGLWGENGTFSDRLEEIHMRPELLIQAEHTAQVDKAVSRRFQEDFKNHFINILSCSTTMEMGVDLGSLEVVLLNSVPPSPASYKQRSGRSGRAAQVRSVCITLCGSDAVGLATLNNAMDNIINREVEVPKVDLESRQVIQRHVNAFLVRAFNVFGNGSLGQKVIDYYTPFRLNDRASNSREKIAYLPDGITEATPRDRLGDKVGTPYQIFNDSCDSPDDEAVVRPLDILLSGTGFSASDCIAEAKRANMACYGSLLTYVEALKQEIEETGVSQKRVNYLKWKYNSELKNRLLDFWATNRFTPNANMPVNVIGFEIYKPKRNMAVNLPTYGLREALAQYCPGSTVAIDGVVYPVQGLTPKCHAGTREPFRRLYRNINECRIDNANLAHPIPWMVNNDIALEMVTPESFLPGLDNERSRIINGAVFTRVSSQLIDTDNWSDDDASQLISFRTNRETQGYILYYNEGNGNGFCMCTACNRIVLEESVADPNDKLANLPDNFNPLQEIRDDDSGSDQEPRLYHKALSGRNSGSKCIGSFSPVIIHRNVIIGDKIQTDFCEIRIRKSLRDGWISSRSNDESLLTTLAIVFTQALVEVIGKERSAVDFNVMPNGHICIFDTNPGGAGYSLQLRYPSVQKAVIERAKEIISNAQSKDALLDRYTNRYEKNIIIKLVQDWFKLL